MFALRLKARISQHGRALVEGFFSKLNRGAQPDRLYFGVNFSEFGDSLFRAGGPRLRGSDCFLGL